MLKFTTTLFDDTQTRIKPLFIIGKPFDFLPYVEEILTKLVTMGYAQNMKDQPDLFVEQIERQREQFVKYSEKTCTVGYACYGNDWFPNHFDDSFDATQNEYDSLALRIVSVKTFLSSSFTHTDTLTISQLSPDLDVFGDIVKIYKDGENISDTLFPAILPAVMDTVIRSENTIMAEFQILGKIMDISDEEIQKIIPILSIYRRAYKMYFEKEMHTRMLDAMIQHFESNITNSEN
jgi:hypothetical protein